MHCLSISYVLNSLKVSITIIALVGRDLFFTLLEKNTKFFLFSVSICFFRLLFNAGGILRTSFRDETVAIKGKFRVPPPGIEPFTFCLRGGTASDEFLKV